MNSGHKITLFSVGAIGSVLLLSKFLNKPKKKKSKRELISKRRKEINVITENITFTPNGDNINYINNILYLDEYIEIILPYLTTFDYLNTICYLSKYHYLYLHHNHHNYQINKYLTYNMLLNESNLSWNINQIEVIFNNKPFMDIYDFMYSICNNWKYFGISNNIKIKNRNNYRHLEIIEQMICIPFIIPNINIVKYWFSYISKKTQVPIRHLSFKTLKTNNNHKINNKKNNKNNKKLTNYFQSALENPFELNLFLWIIIYNLYQLNMELNKIENKNRNIIHSNYFGFEHKLQEWLVYEHKYTFLKSDISALLKLYNMIINDYSSSNDHIKYNKNMVYILCIMFKVIFHNTELHIVRVNKYNQDDIDWHKLQHIFLKNLYNVITFIQYVIQINNNDIHLFKTFKSLLKKSNVKMVNNILTWFYKVNYNNNKNHSFYISKHNILSLDVLPIYFQIMGLKSDISDKHNIAIWLPA